jgi:hypothetical protein
MTEYSFPWRERRGNSGLSFPAFFVHIRPLHPIKTRSSAMQSEYFWNSTDGQILSLKNKGADMLSLVLAFWPRNPAELEFIRARLNDIHFTERSTLARIGIEMITSRAPEVEHNRLVLETDAFQFDPSFPNAPYWKKLLRPGTPVGRLFYAPESAKLATSEIWEAVKEQCENLAMFKRIKYKESLRLVDEPFQKSVKLDIKRYLYKKAP